MTRRFFIRLPFLFLLLLAFSHCTGCFGADEPGRSGGGSPGDDDDYGDDSGDDGDDDDTGPVPQTGESLRLGLVHYHYYGDLGGYDGETFKTDQEWAARDIDLGIIGWGDEWMERAWEAIKSHQPKGSWLKWRLAHFLATNRTAGDCASPSVGAQDEFFLIQEEELQAFLEEFPEYGDGEECFLHARHDGRVRPWWHVSACEIELAQKGYEGSAASMSEARLFTLVWDDYGWLFDLSGACARDFISWRTMKDMRDEGFGGAGFDNLGSPIDDGFYLPTLIDNIDVMEIPDMYESSLDALEAWWSATVETFLESVAEEVRSEEPEAVVVYNGAAYCSWETSVERLKKNATEGLGVWCENAFAPPAWSDLSDADRLLALYDLSVSLARDGSFLALETFYGGGQSNPTPEEILYYLAAYYVFKNGDDVLAVKPDWDPYAPLIETCWFDIFSRDLGSPTGGLEQNAGEVFSRDYERPDGLRSVAVVRPASDAAGANFSLVGVYCRADADDALTPVTGSIPVEQGEGVILLQNDTGDVHCE